MECVACILSGTLHAQSRGLGDWLIASTRQRLARGRTWAALMRVSTWAKKPSPRVGRLAATTPSHSPAAAARNLATGLDTHALPDSIEQNSRAGATPWGVAYNACVHLSAVCERQQMTAVACPCSVRCRVSCSLR